MLFLLSESFVDLTIQKLQNILDLALLDQNLEMTEFAMQFIALIYQKMVLSIVSISSQ